MGHSLSHCIDSIGIVESVSLGLRVSDHESSSDIVEGKSDCCTEQRGHQNCNGLDEVVVSESHPHSFSDPIIGTGQTDIESHMPEYILPRPFPERSLFLEDVDGITGVDIVSSPFLFDLGI